MSYYFPFGGSQGVTTQNINYALTAVTASVPYTPTITALTASFASSVKNTPPAGTNGTNKTVGECGPSTISGSAGSQGSQGPKGADNVTCPAGTIECTDLNQHLPNLNNSKSRPSGSQFVKVCMEIPPGCTSLTAVCPPYLPSASVTSTYPSIP